VDRRTFISSVTLGLLVLAAEAQPVSKVWHIGFVGAEAYSTNWHSLDAFRLGMREHGYVEGKNINIEARWAEGRTERFHDLVAELPLSSDRR
jgi:putative ABC transport system substrate-binding protein